MRNRRAPAPEVPSIVLSASRRIALVDGRWSLMELGGAGWASSATFDTLRDALVATARSTFEGAVRRGVAQHGRPTLLEELAGLIAIAENATVSSLLAVEARAENLTRPGARR